jgi:Protein of unknown function (DUF3347)
MKQIVVAAVVILLVACGNDEKNKKDIPQGPLSKTANTENFTLAFSGLMNNYFHLKDNFITESDTGIVVYAKALMHDADSLPLNDLKADTAIIATAKSFADGISAEIKGMLNENDVEVKRKSFQMISMQLFDLIRTVQYDKEVVYLQHCPMAFNEQGADWLSNSKDIRNPYIPKKMLTCGEVKDSASFKKN